MVNKIILLGNVGSDPEINYLDNGISVAKLKLATSETYKDKEGKKVTNTEWHSVVLWRGLANIAENWIHKGSLIYIEGKVTYRKYEKDGETKFFTEIVASELRLLGGNKNSNSEKPNSSETKNEKSTEEILNDDDSDYLPF